MTKPAERDGVGVHGGEVSRGGYREGEGDGASVGRIDLAFIIFWCLLNAKTSYMPKPSTTALRGALHALQRVPFVRFARKRAPQSDASDAAVQLVLGDGSTVTLEMELHSSHLSAAAANALGRRLGELSGDWLLVAPYIGAPIGDELANRGINFIDRHGNCHLRIDNRYLARVQGKTPPKVEASAKAMRAPGFQVLFALLAEPELASAPQREIAQAAGTSRQPVADMLGRLVADRFLVKRGRQHAWAESPNSELLERFVAGYRSTLRPRLLVGRYRLPVQAPRDVEAWLEEKAQSVMYGGTAGGYRLEKYYRGPLTVAYLGDPTESARRRLKASPKPDGELVWMHHIGEASKRGGTANSVHPLLVYAEMVSSQDPRAHETAVMIREKCLPWSL